LAPLFVEKLPVGWVGLLTPKSEILRTNEEEMSTLSGLISRWTISWEWMDEPLHLPQSFNLGRHFTGKLFITVNVIVDSPNANFQYQIPTNIE
jgi:hypothetical protein